MGEKVGKIIFSIFFLISFITALLAVSVIGILSGWFLEYSWLDKIFHLAGGFWAVVLFIGVFYRFPELQKFSGFLESKILTIVLSLSFASLIGLSWEFYEFIFGNIGDLKDTMADLFLDLAGGFFGALLGTLLIKIKNPDTANRY